MSDITNRKKVQLASDETIDDFNVKIKEIDVKEKEEFIKSDAKEFNFAYINLFGFPISQDALKIISKADAEKYKMVCFFYGDRQLRLGVVNPKEKKVQDFIAKIKDIFFNKKIVVYLISENSFIMAFNGYAKLPEEKKKDDGVRIIGKDLKKFKDIKNFKDITDKIKKISLTDVVNLLLGVAINIDASDIHIEAEKDSVKVRFRIDGILHDVTVLPKEKWKILISRIKLVSGLKINVNDKPQDGRFTVFIDKEQIDIRISTLPTAFGESVAIRILMFSREMLTIKELGLSDESSKILEKGVKSPNGMILNTGPTGSGKTTTLYSILTKLNKEGIKIITIEDPIEYRLEGINQSSVNSDSGYTFTKAIRSLVRQDPDIIMVGEIRDIDTADTAIQSALTGHLVLSTVHTNSASGAIARLLSMGVKDFLLVPALNTIMAQRLVRRICPHCKEKIKIDDKTIEQIKNIFTQSTKQLREKINLNKLNEIDFYKGNGCDKCGNIGYKGRIGIFEIIDFNKDMKDIVLSDKNISEAKMQETAINKGMVTMAQDGILKAIKGITTVEEVFRVSK
ncbi:MAG: GspE/PulE family protein [Patescibacteria group bacterium]|nr:GspE/PulE family protein [Patescibacteria group bacterium]